MSFRIFLCPSVQMLNQRFDKIAINFCIKIKINFRFRFRFRFIFVPLQPQLVPAAACVSE